jgi:hypothetical protein
MSTAALSAGSHSISVAYSGDANFNASSSSAAVVTVVAAPTPDYALSVSASKLNVTAGAAGTITLTVSPENGFKQAVGFACSGLPSGASCSFNPMLVTPTSGPVNATLKIQVPAMMAANFERTSPARLSSHAEGRYILQTRMAASFALLLGLGFVIIGIIRSANGKQLSPALAKFLQAMVASLLLATTLVVSGCAGLTGADHPSPQGTAKTYTVTVTASGANAPTHTQSFTLTVAP